MFIPYVNLEKQWKEERNFLLPIIDKVLNSGQYVGGDQIDKFENNICKKFKSKYCVALNSGTDALTLALYVLGIKKGDEVITTPNSFIASTAVIVHLGAKPVFVDVKKDQNIDTEKIESAITKKTKVIMPVHLTGRMCEMDKILKIAKKNNLLIVEDAAQSIGSKYKNIFSGNYGNIGCFSTHPLKNLNATGDGGFIVTSNKSLFQKIQSLRSHGIANRNKVKHFGYVSRMDNLQAAILNFRLKKLNKIISLRRLNAEKYIKNINNPKIFINKENLNTFNTFHTFVIQTKFRKKLIKHLEENKIGTAIHYPVPIHLQPASKFLGYKKGDFPIVEQQAKQILTLPINQYLKKDEVEKIINVINKF